MANRDDTSGQFCADLCCQASFLPPPLLEDDATDDQGFDGDEELSDVEVHTRPPRSAKSVRRSNRLRRASLTQVLQANSIILTDSDSENEWQDDDEKELESVPSTPPSQKPSMQTHGDDSFIVDDDSSDLEELSHDGSSEMIMDESHSFVSNNNLELSSVEREDSEPREQDCLVDPKAAVPTRVKTETGGKPPLSPRSVKKQSSPTINNNDSLVTVTSPTNTTSPSQPKSTQAHELGNSLTASITSPLDKQPTSPNSIFKRDEQSRPLVVDLLETSSDEEDDTRASPPFAVDPAISFLIDSSSSDDERLPNAPLYRKIKHIIETSGEESSSEDDESTVTEESAKENSKYFRERSQKMRLIESDSDTTSSLEELIDRTKGVKLTDDDVSKEPVKPQPTTNTKPTPRKNQSVMLKEMSQMLLKTFDRHAFGGNLTKTTCGQSAVAVEWSTKLRTTAGQTRMKRITCPNRRIAIVELSTKVIDDEPKLRSTLLHELCHAAAWVMDENVKPPHGPVFQKWAKVAMKAFPDIKVTTTHSYEIAFKYSWKCTRCSAVIKRHTRSVNVQKQVCGNCKGRLVENFTKKPRAPSAYNLFVKQHSKSIRLELLKSNTTVTQAQVMKECGKRWKACQKQS